MRPFRSVTLSPSALLSLRAGFCLAVPLAVGIITGHREYATTFALGALWAISQDGSDSWSVRRVRLASVAVAAGFGIALGGIVATWTHDPMGLILLYGAAALVGGLVEASGRAAPGMYFILGAIVGGGLGFHGQSWSACLLVSLGSLWVLGVASFTDSRSRVENQRLLLAEGIDRVVVTLASVGDEMFPQRRSAAVLALDSAQDAIGSRSPKDTDAEAVALAQCLIIALRSGEIISYLAGRGVAAPIEITDPLEAMSASLKEGSARHAIEALPDLARAKRTTLDVVAASVFTPSDPSTLTRQRLRGTARFVIPWPERVRFALMLAAAILLASSIARVLDGSHGFWLPLAVAFIARPDLGPVIPRALARTVGTFLGVGIAVVVALAGNPELLLMGLSCAMAALVPWASRRSHLLTVMFFTPIIFVFLAVLGSDQTLFLPRVVDTAIGALIVLSMDVVAWSTAPSLRPEEQLARATKAVEEYRRCGRADGAIERNRRRRFALRAVANARSASELARSEPRWLRRHGAVQSDVINELDRAIDEHTVSIVGSREA